MKTLLSFILLCLPANVSAQQSVASTEPDTAYVYLMPCLTNETKVRRLSAVEMRRAHNLNMIDYMAWEFAFTSTATVITFSRGGKITSMNEDSVTVLHDDGTKARYGRIDSFVPTVKEGETVKAGDLIGQPSQVGSNEWAVSFELFYSVENPNRDPRTAVNARYEYIEYYLDPIFRSRRTVGRLVERETYTPVSHKNWLGIWR